jgi:hypothetical protein
MSQAEKRLLPDYPEKTGRRCLIVLVAEQQTTILLITVERQHMTNNLSNKPG